MGSSSKHSSPTTTEEAIELFESLSPATSEEMIGRWVGSEFPTGHPMDGMLSGTGWYGKAFHSPSDVRPMIFRLPLWGEVEFNPSRMPTQLLVALPVFPGREPICAVFMWLFCCVFVTQSPQAKLDTVKFRGKHRAAMIYDRAPVTDFFAKLDDNTVLGLMDMRGVEKPFFFKLRRETPTKHES